MTLHRVSGRWRPQLWMLDAGYCGFSCLAGAVLGDFPETLEAAALDVGRRSFLAWQAQRFVFLKLFQTGFRQIQTETGFRMVSHWFQTGFRLVSNKFKLVQIGFRLLSQIVFRQVLDWLRFGFSWLQIGFRMVSKWIQTCFRLVSI